MFIQKDPIGLLGGVNVFAYAPNPVGWVDVFGLSFKWGEYLSKTLGVPKPSATEMEDAHAHHIVFKEGSELSKPIIAQSKLILEHHNIDWLMGKENLIWAPNKGHSVENAIRVLEALQDAHNNGKGSRADVVGALRRMGQAFADESIESIPLRRHSVSTKGGKKTVTCISK